MTLTTKDCADLNLGIYGITPVTWDKYDDGSADDGVCWAIKSVQDVHVIVFRGSDNLKDWMRDVMALTKPWGAQGLGPVHPGFFLGMLKVWGEIKSSGQPLNRMVVTGHSLGAGRTKILVGEMVLDKTPPIGMVRFGSPRPGFKILSDVVKPVPSWSYRNTDGGRHHDLVTNVPFSFPPESYTDEQPIDLTVTPTPEADDPLGMFRFHHIQLYAGAVPATTVV